MPLVRFALAGIAAACLALAAGQLATLPALMVLSCHQELRR